MKEVSERERDLPRTIIEKLTKLASESKETLSLSIGEPDFSMPRPLVKDLKKIVRKHKKNKLNHYTSGQGISELREAIAEKLYRENKIKVSADEVLVTAGSQQALFAGFLSALDPGEEVILSNPGYLGYIPAIELVNGVPSYVPLKEEEKFVINPDLIKKVVTKKTRIILLNSPSNPTGTVLHKKILEEIADIAVDKDLFVFSDEAYEKLIYDGKKHISIGSFNGMKDYVLTFHTFSKSYALCGFRLGYAAGQQKMIDAMQKSVHYMSLCPSHLSQLLGVRALHLQAKYIEKMRREYDRRRLFLVQRLNEMGLPTVKPEGAFYTFSNISAYNKNSLAFANALLKKEKVAVVPGTEFGSAGEGYIRCSYATEYIKIEKAMHRLERFLKKH
ncbi:MAG: aminotransferase [archaeon GW2011_AR17]|nr:MAG: aminotransferase [archaeon GW2011_AR17]MBS3154060.1 pyridoxal phosphate-dependent aminotransferase [Candidatus Woesearchaeota archaeon]HIH15550.1 pyridoxal phosphate-dependent aminotransferase [Nanoarchaeota archaeon]HIH59118.1 pyridoxal phosphate-dependent aminotransferase [Nanoarchaeota archaeon]HII14594.1 pyridoxal phosphate-dependent aminotransferase [Nanoarchaeota archaeon]